MWGQSHIKPTPTTTSLGPMKGFLSEPSRCQWLQHLLPEQRYYCEQQPSLDLSVSHFTLFQTTFERSHPHSCTKNRHHLHQPPPNVNSDISPRDHEGSTESLEGLQLPGNVESGASFQYLTLSSFPSYIFSFTPSLLLQWFTIFFTSRSSFDIIQSPSFLRGYVPLVII